MIYQISSKGTVFLANGGEFKSPIANVAVIVVIALIIIAGVIMVVRRKGR